MGVEARDAQARYCNDFGWAIKQLKKGNRVARYGWNGKGMYVFSAPAIGAIGEDLEVLPFISMKTADNKICVGWLASQTDMLSEDWGPTCG